MNIKWRAITVTHRGIQHTSSQEEAASAQTSTRYEQTAELIPATFEWKSPIPPKPRITGAQIARVVGPASEEIYCDEWGRIKVQFPWDRQGQENESSSCWIRVAQGWGIGAGDGQMSIPRIGQEVIVEYLDQDPDQPIVIGRTNDALNPPPYELPKHKTRSTWRSQTHKGQGFNEIRFEDENQQEEIYIHAQKDQNIHINHDETTFIGHDRSEHIENDESLFIGNDRQKQVVGSEAVKIGKYLVSHIGGSEDRVVDQAQNITVGHDCIVQVNKNRQDIIAASHETKVGGHYKARVEGNHHISAGQKIIRETQVYELGVQERIIFRSPGAKITLDATGITLDGNINIRGSMNQIGVGTGEATVIEGIPFDPEISKCTEKP